MRTDCAFMIVLSTGMTFGISNMSEVDLIVLSYTLVNTKCSLDVMFHNSSTESMLGCALICASYGHCDGYAVKTDNDGYRCALLTHCQVTGNYSNDVHWNIYFKEGI